MTHREHDPADLLREHLRAIASSIWNERSELHCNALLVLVRSAREENVPVRDLPLPFESRPDEDPGDDELYSDADRLLAVFELAGNEAPAVVPELEVMLSAILNPPIGPHAG